MKNIKGFTEAAKMASAAATDSRFWQDIAKHLEAKQTARKPVVEPRKLRHY